MFYDDAAIIVIIIVRQNTVPESTKISSYDSADEAIEAASFDMDYPDRLCGYPAADFESNSSTIEVSYMSAGFVRKTLGVSDNSGNNGDYTESEEIEINGMSITLKGKDSKYYTAVWSYNNFAYTISLSDGTGGVDKDEMTDYILSTR